MVKCAYCEKEMTEDHTGCLPVVVVDGKAFKRIPNYLHFDVRERCHDCGVDPDYVHHFGCDMEDCPSCGLQLISCDCEIVQLRG